MNERTSELHKLRTLHLFAGAGGGIYADLLLGHRCVCAVEIDPYRQQVLSARQRDCVFPWFPIYSDVTQFNGSPWRGIVDIVSGGFPCTDISVAGNGAGIEGKASGLWKQQSRIIGEIRPRYAFLENSPALVGRGLGIVLGDLAALGYDARWCVLGGADAGMEVDGERIWILAKAAENGWPKVLRADTGWRTETPCGGQADNDGSRGWIERIHALEKVAGESAILGSGDGMADTINRLEALGDGQIPRLASIAWRTLSQ